ncbi:SEC-C domain-containing protein [Desulforhopalus vacuolatus]|uniref:YecA family protein n=1 Tax=Desulforhopalus vacuolatus TaxID=40414 RepID=UPI001963DE40|nr:SEC-C metal-binding domain-containing protein [Desulforhopalus vacuolatus]MBM9519787.1 SEC-C domain-containing protein [Desulforhopalus vacuolatus]
MAKIGRNEKCPCGSGRKFKKCCGRKTPAQMQQTSRMPAGKTVPLTLMSAVEQIQRDAFEKKILNRELGVFFFFTNTAGDAWMLEMTDQDGIQVAEGGKVIEATIEENSETIEVNWTHSYTIENRQLKLTSWKDKNSFILEGSPVSELNAAMRRIRKRFTPEQLEQVHVEGSGKKTD